VTPHSLLDVRDEAHRGPAIDEAVNAVGRGALVVLPTDTVYAPESVAALLSAKGRGRQMPPPVLVPDVRTLDGLATDVSDDARALVDAFWPGGFTIILAAQPSLMWDLGDTNGTVALRMPDHDAALALLRRTGPLAVSSANRTGMPSALTATDAQEQLGDAVAVYLDGGTVSGGVASTIVDATGPRPRVLRQGAIALEALRAIVPGVLAADDPAGDDPAAADPEPGVEDRTA
jgi:tRNA threonylcarbamoyl adenosine modification protein (Sua5/YciO/YrdC/YwlC family)